MKKLLFLSSVSVFALSGTAFAQSNPGWSFGFIPTASQWNTEFGSKADATNGTLTNPTLSGTVTYTQPPDPLNLLRDSAADPTGAIDASSAIQGLLTKIGLTGGTLYVPYGTYLLQSTPLISSNTRIQCAPGTMFRLGSSHTGYGIANVNNGASTLTDHDIVIEDCGVDLVNFTASGSKHAIEMNFVERVSIIRPVCINGGGDCVSIQGSDTAVIRDGLAGSVATPIQNCCWDVWNASTNVLISGGTCTSALYGAQVTGTNTNSTSAGVSANCVIENGTYNQTSFGAPIWLNGLGLAGSGVNNCRISHNYINDASTVNTAIKISGAGTDVVIDGNVITGGGAQGILTGTDSGGVPTHTVITNNLFDGVNATGGPLIKLNGTGDTVTNNTITGGTFTYDIQLLGTNQLASGNHIVTAGSSGAYNFTAAQGNKIEDPFYQGSWTPTLKFGGATTGMIQAANAGEYWFLEGGLFRACGRVALTNVGSATGAASIGGLPFGPFVTGPPFWYSFQIGRTASITGTATMQVLMQNSGGGTIALNTSYDSGGSALQNTAFSGSSVLEFCGEYLLN